MQGSDISTIRIGLYYKEELVSLMTFSKPRFTKLYEYELVRFCNKTNTSVIGGASKLFHHFVNSYKPKSIISYADKRYSDGKLYEKLKFSFKENTRLNYFYIKSINGKNFEKISRYSAQKHNLKKLLPIYNPNLSESENMFDNKYRRFWNCGNLVYTFFNINETF
jgi:hypothetical protein